MRAMLARGLLLAWRGPGDSATSAGFYVLVAGLVSLATAPFGLPSRELAAIAAWIGALMATLLAQQHALRQEAAAGVLDQMRLAPGGALAGVAGVLAARVLVTCIPLLLATPAIAVFFGLSAVQCLALVASLLAGLPAVCVIAVFASALTLASRATAAALAIVVLPLAAPVLLFGVRAASSDDPHAALLLLGASSLVATALGPFAIDAALSLEEGE